MPGDTRTPLGKVLALQREAGQPAMLTLRQLRCHDEALSAGEEPVSAIVSGSYGGNLVLRDLGAGSHLFLLFLPVAKPGGRMWTGDVHALQGDGVVESG